jgi:DNA-binding NarL/FixJ family response regulator
MYRIYRITYVGDASVPDRDQAVTVNFRGNGSLEGSPVMDAETSLEKGHGSTRLAIVDDHELAREGLRDMLTDAPDIEVVGEAANGREALLLCSRLQPDLVLMDVRMPEMDGLAATRELKQRYPEVSVMMVTMHENPDYLLEALKAGAAGYVLKDAPRSEVITAVRRVREGEASLAPELAARLLRRLATENGGRRGARSADGDITVDSLTPRELEVLQLMQLGGTNRHVAEELFISRGTVKRHVENIIAKLGVSDRTQAVVRALELGVLELSEEQ